MLFVYTAVNANGERITEQLDAPDLTHAQQELLRRGLCVLQCEAGRRSLAGAVEQGKASRKNCFGVVVFVRLKTYTAPLVTMPLVTCCQTTGGDRSWVVSRQKSAALTDQLTVRVLLLV